MAKGSKAKLTLEGFENGAIVAQANQAIEQAIRDFRAKPGSPDKRSVTVRVDFNEKGEGDVRMRAKVSLTLGKEVQPWTGEWRIRVEDKSGQLTFEHLFADEEEEEEEYEDEAARTPMRRAK